MNEDGKVQEGNLLVGKEVKQGFAGLISKNSTANVISFIALLVSMIALGLNIPSYKNEKITNRTFIAPIWRVEFSSTKITLKELTNSAEVKSIKVYYYDHIRKKVLQKNLSTKKSEIKLNGPLEFSKNFNRVINNVRLENATGASFSDVMVSGLNAMFVEGGLPVIIETKFQDGKIERTVKSVYRIDLRSKFQREDGLTTSIKEVAVGETIFRDFLIYAHIENNNNSTDVLTSYLREQPTLGKEKTETLGTTLITQSFYGR